MFVSTPRLRNNNHRSETISWYTCRTAQNNFSVPRKKNRFKHMFVVCFNRMSVRRPFPLFSVHYTNNVNTLTTHMLLRTLLSFLPVTGCSDGTFGPTCESVCQCYNFQPCNKVTGTCPPGGCEAGYQGRTCDSGMAETK